MEQKNLVPKRRFKEFQNTSAWEQRKLGEVADIIGGGTPSTSNEEYWDGDIDWYSPVEIGEQIYVDSSQKKITELGLQKSSAKILPIGTVLFTSRAGIGNTAILAKEGATNQGFQSIVPHKDELDSYFIYSRTHELKRYGETNGAGSTFVEVSGKQMAQMPILIPTLEEQKKIGGFFERLDNLITLHQRKLEKMKALKSAYLSEMFPAEGEPVPKRRFAGFTQAWEQRKLGEMMEVTSVKRIHQSDWTDEGVRFLRARDIVCASKGEEPTDYLYISQEKYDEYSRISGKVKVGDLLVTGVGTIGVPLLVTQEEPLYFKDGNIIWFKNEKQLDGNFFYYSFIGESIQKYIRDVAGIGTVGTYTIDSGKKTPIQIPSYEEQEKIGNFFKQLDHLITLHQRKLEKLQNIKKAYLNEMFV
ncbi:restriction endonuclease subunit S [Heyndrickxia coagulans]|uniref:restriction endonuclease subunit S n=1 Tax=Heyndrickxia coagulans TaxID=1398 RepID=UPI000779EC83|nr:restriction endonuclease subunit S [Heyndrickxia coagulans]KYC65503.1 Type I restriction-modification system, specificity subunit S [Heyndrickxia coagulans]